MRKEIIFVILISIVFGAIIAFGVFRANTALNNKDDQSTTKPPLKDEQQENSDGIGLTIAHLSQDDVLTEPQVILSGITSPHSWIVISAEEEDFIIQSDNQGSFEQQVDLVGGINQIIIRAFDKKNNSAYKTIRLIYSSEFAKYINETEE